MEKQLSPQVADLVCKVLSLRDEGKTDEEILKMLNESQIFKYPVSAFKIMADDHIQMFCQLALPLSHIQVTYNA